MHIIDTVVSREGKNSAWVSVVFLGDKGESIAVRVPCAIPTGTEVGRNYIIKRAALLISKLVTCEGFDRLGESVWSPNQTHLGAPPETPFITRETVGSWSSTWDD